MTVDENHADDFDKYVEPLEALEKAFNAAEMHIRFHATVDPAYGKVIKVIGDFASQKIICIEADSLAAAIKDVAARVKIS
jgi:hypothetical protein